MSCPPSGGLLSDFSSCLIPFLEFPAAISAYKNYDLEVHGGTPEEKRPAFADYLLEEYDFFLDYYSSKK